MKNWLLGFSGWISVIIILLSLTGSMTLPVMYWSGYDRFLLFSTTPGFIGLFICIIILSRKRESG